MRELVVRELDTEAVQKVASALAALQEDELKLVFGDVICCPHFIVPILGLVEAYRAKGAHVALEVPPHTVVHEACFGERPFGRVWAFDNEEELVDIVNRIETESAKIAHLGKGFKVGFAWCLTEVMDNVLAHSRPTGEKPSGCVMVQYVPEDNLFKACVFDAGMGLLKSFEGSKYHPADAVDALKLAVQPNVTSGVGQGNGLYGLRELVKQSRQGRLQIRSDGAEYVMTARPLSETCVPTWNFEGLRGTTTVDFQVVTGDELSFGKVFPDAFPKTDLWLEAHELDESTVRLRVLDEIPGTGSRALGRQLRTLLENIVNNDRKQVVLDFEGVELCSSAFVDELVGKLVLEYGFMGFSRSVRLVHVTAMNELLINHSLVQRLAEQRLP